MCYFNHLYNNFSGLKTEDELDFADLTPIYQGRLGKVVQTVYLPLSILNYLTQRNPCSVQEESAITTYFPNLI